MKRYIIKLVDNAMPEPEYWLYGKTWGIDRSDATMFVSEKVARQHCISMGWYKERQAMGAIEIEEVEHRSPVEILDELDALEVEIQDGLKRLREMLA